MRPVTDSSTPSHLLYTTLVILPASLCSKPVTIDVVCLEAWRGQVMWRKRGGSLRTHQSCAPIKAPRPLQRKWVDKCTAATRDVHPPCSADPERGGTCW